jgi:hypothetical protein
MVRGLRNGVREYPASNLKLDVGKLSNMHGKVHPERRGSKDELKRRKSPPLGIVESYCVSDRKVL